MALTTHQQRLLRYSLACVWLGTAVVSAWEFQGQSQALLIQAGLVNDHLIAWLIGGGIAADALLGLALLAWPNRTTFIACLLMMVVMTILATYLTPQLWLHPIGPLLKNIPIAGILWVLLENAK